MNWKIVSSIKAHLQQETGTQVFPPGLRLPIAFLYPNVYALGMSNLGMHILYQILNAGGYACERFFLPERHLLREYEKSRTPLLSYETQRVLADFPYICVMMSFELDYPHLLQMLALSHIKLRAAARGEKEPLVIIGGPCATFNPEPLAPIADCFVIGEGEETLPRLLKVLEDEKAAGKSREARLLAAAQVPGVYVPRFYTPVYQEPVEELDEETGEVVETGATVTPTAAGNASPVTSAPAGYPWPEQVALRVDPRVPQTIARQWVRDLDAYPHTSAIVTEGTEFSNMYIVETARGCGRHCRFCMAGYCFRKPRNRNLERLWADIEGRPAVTSRVGLMGAAVSDYPEMHELTRRLVDAGVPFSVASLRADMLDTPLVQALAESGQRTMTVAPEAGSVRLRAAINKGITADHVYHAMQLAAQAGMPNVKLYYMLGLPGEDEQDMADLFAMLHQVRADMQALGYKGELICSVNAFVPKPFTPFQWSAFAEKKYLDAALKILRGELKSMRGVEIISESVKSAEIQAILSRGDRKISEIILQSESMQDFKKNFNLDKEFYLRQRNLEENLPWDFLNQGFSKKYLIDEFNRAKNFKATTPCFDGCKRCGVCEVI